MAQVIVDTFICGGRYRVQLVRAVGRHPVRIIEIEEVDTRQRIHGSPRRLARLTQVLCKAAGESPTLGIPGGPKTSDR